MKTIILASVMLLNVVIAMAQSVSGTASNLGCQNSGIVTATATGLTAPVQYQLLLGTTVVAPVSGDATQFTNNNVFQGLAPGTYTLKARDANGANLVTSANIAVTDGFTSLTVTTPTKVNQCIGGTSVLVTSITGGKAPFVYKISTSAAPSTYLETSASTSATSYSFAALSTGSYLVSVTDNCGQTITAATSISDRTITVNDITATANTISRSSCTADITLLAGFGKTGGTLSATEASYFTYKIKYQGQLYGQDTNGDTYPDVGGAGFPLSSGSRKLPVNATAAGVLADISNMKMVVDDGCGNTKELSVIIESSSLTVRNCSGSGLINYGLRGLLCYPLSVTFTNVSNSSDVYTTSLTTQNGSFTAPLTPGATYKVSYTDGAGATSGYFNTTTTYTVPSTTSFAVSVWSNAASSDYLGYGAFGISLTAFTVTDQLTYTVLASTSSLVPIGYSNTVTISALAGAPSQGLAFLPKPNTTIPNGSFPLWPKGTYTLAFTSPCGSSTLSNFVVNGLAFTLTGNTITPTCGGFNYVLNGNFDNTNYEVVITSGPSNVGVAKNLASTSASLSFDGLGYGTYVFGVRVKGNTTILASQTVTYGAANVIVVDAANTGGYVCTAGATDGTLSISAVSNSPAPGNTLQYAISKDGGTTYSAYQSSNVFTGLSSGVYYYKIKDGCLNEITQTAQIGVAAAPTASANGVATPATVCLQTSGTIQLDVSVTGAASYLWTGPGITAANQSLKNPTVPYTSLSVGANNYTCTITLGAPCNSVTVAPLVITGKALPAAPGVSDVTYCQNASTSSLTATGTSLLWYTAATGGTGSTTAPTPSAANGGTTTYYVTQTVNGCEGPRAAINVVVNPLPVASASGGCSGTSPNGKITLSAADAGTGATYTWSGPLNYTAVTTATSTSLAYTTTSQNGTYTLSVTRNGCAATATSTVNIQCTTPLPVTLMSFSGRQFEKTVVLGWTTSLESKTSHFEVMHSTDALSFEVTGRVSAQGNSSSLLTYGWIDSNPVQGVNYYRLRTVDLDGSSELSRIVSVRFSDNNKTFVVVNPAETDGRVLVITDVSEPGFSFSDLSGRILNTTLLEHSQNRFWLRVDRPIDLRIGVLRVQSKEGVYTQKVLFP